MYFSFFFFLENKMQCGGVAKFGIRLHSGVWSKVAAEEVIGSIGFWGYPEKNQNL